MCINERWNLIAQAEGLIVIQMTVDTHRVCCDIALVLHVYGIEHINGNVACIASVFVCGTRKILS